VTPWTIDRAALERIRAAFAREGEGGPLVECRLRQGDRVLFLGRLDREFVEELRAAIREGKGVWADDRPGDDEGEARR
jgi:hypothetical protein